MYLILMVRILFYSLKSSYLLFEENKQLDRSEYNLWTIRTAGEEITDDDWLSIRGK